MRRVLAVLAPVLMSLLALLPAEPSSALTYTLSEHSVDDVTTALLGQEQRSVRDIVSVQPAVGLPDLCASAGLCGVDVVALSVSFDYSTGVSIQILDAGLAIDGASATAASFIPGPPGQTPHAADVVGALPTWSFGSPGDLLTPGSESGLLLAVYPEGSLGSLNATGTLHLTLDDALIGSFAIDNLQSALAPYPAPEPGLPALVAPGSIGALLGLTTRRARSV